MDEYFIYLDQGSVAYGLHQINQLGGLISGAVRGVLLVLIAVWALRLTGIYLTDDVVSGSYLLKLTVLFLDRIGLGAAVL